MNVKKVAFFATIACVLALLATIGLYKHNQSSHDTGVRSASHALQYLAAAKDIHDGDRIGPDDVMVVTWGGDQPVPNAYAPADKGKVVGRLASYPVSNGKLLTEDLLASSDSSLGLTHKIPAGFRAFSVRSTEVNDFGGFLYPGAKVDILVSIKAGDKTPARSLSLVQDVVVLATGKQLTPDPAGKPTSVDVITVLVTPEQAQKIALAQEEGVLYFSLRSGGDEEMREDRPTLFSEIGGTPPPPVERRRPLGSEAPFPPAGTPVVTVFGNQSSTQFFRGNLPVNAPVALRPEAQNDTPGAQK
jgi:pilus assembly protein CpaB